MSQYPRKSNLDEVVSQRSTKRRARYHVGSIVVHLTHGHARAFDHVEREFLRPVARGIFLFDTVETNLSLRVRSMYV